MDMEEGVLGEVMKGSLCSLFDHNQFISSFSGSGNNWYTQGFSGFIYAEVHPGVNQRIQIVGGRGNRTDPEELDNNFAQI